jgi:hypothetical protein
MLTFYIYIQWAWLNGITDNGINRIIESQFQSVPLARKTGLFNRKRNSLIGIRYGLAQSDPNKQHLL